MKVVLIAAGGTGGHIFPALAVAEALKSQGVSVFWVGSSRALEQRLVQPHFDLTCLSVESLRGRSRWGLVKAPLRLLRALVESVKCIRRCKPDVVLTFGSFVSGPVGIASWLLSKPLVVHEQNAVAGMTNRILARFASKVLPAFIGSFPSAVQQYVVGNPVRAELLSFADPATRFQGRMLPLKILILGGSQGATALNDVVVQWCQRYALADEVCLWHQVGHAHEDVMSSAYAGLDINVRVDAFIEDMLEAYAWADVVVCRAGALTVSELMAVGIASLLVPFPYAVDDHQYKNAQFLVDGGAADVVRQEQFTAEFLQDIIQSYIELSDLESQPLLLRRAQRARLLAKPDATQHIIDMMQHVVVEKSEKKRKC
jgi:UDP-N-acetylglucosamine--N-acetylmuramyl-(pentapeptide) pyrophosphoryl-undecaprenol N-acetylglucosamine transferase